MCVHTDFSNCAKEDDGVYRYGNFELEKLKVKILINFVSIYPDPKFVNVRGQSYS